MEPLEEANNTPWTSTWSKIQCPELNGRACHSATVIGDLLIGFGGWDTSEYYNDAVALNLVDLTWQKAIITGDKPKTRYTHSANLFDNDKILIIGGYSPKKGVLRETAVMALTGLEPLSFEWKTIQTEGGEDLYRSDHTANIQGRYLYLFGGANKDEEGTNQLWRLDLEAFTWKKLETTGRQPSTVVCWNIFNLIGERYGHCSAIINDTLYVFGGYTTTLRTQLNDFWQISLENLTWQQIENTPTTPSQRCAATALELDDQIILFGGQTISTGYANYLYSYDTKAQEWQRLKPEGTPPGGRAYHAAAYYKNKLIIWGGEKGKTDCLNDIYSVELEDEALQPKKIDPKTIKQNTALNTLKKMSIDGLFTDIVFEVDDGQNISAHKAILAGGCRYFYDIFINSKSNKIKVTDLNGPTFKVLLKFLYCEDIELDYSMAINLLGFAHKYSLSGLKQVCENYLARSLTKENISKLNKIAEEFQALVLKKAILDFH